MRVLVIGASGSGTSTLGAALAKTLGWGWLDLDDFFWEPTQPPFTTMRERTARLDLLLAALAGHEHAVVSGSPLSWGSAIEDTFDVIVFMTLDTPTRLQRIRTRELATLGAVNEAFFAWAARYDDEHFDGRSRVRHEAWLATKSCPIVRVDGKDSTAAQLAAVLHVLGR